VQDGAIHSAAGDLFLPAVQSDARFAAQREAMTGCLATAMREVYDASAQALGAASAPTFPRTALEGCFSQRATNQAIALGAAIQLENNAPTRAVALGAHRDHMVSIGRDPEVATDTLFVPLTSEVLTRINGVVGSITGFAPSILPQWHEDMAAIRNRLATRVRLDALGTTLSDGGLGPLLGMEPNASYAGVPA
jgi:hypothetical protein